MSSKVAGKIPPVNRKQNMEKYYLYFPAGIVLITFFVYLPTLNSDFINWDDPTFVLGNSNIINLSLQNINNIFTSYCMGNYCPLTILSYAIEYNFSGLNPVLFHTTNLVIHLINTFLVYLLIYCLANKQIIIAFVVSILFGIHPMHVESVAWVSERRDVLYTMFYLLGLLFYCSYVNKKNTLYFICALLFYLFSLFSKGQAVTFSIVILLIDYLYNRKPDLKLILEKIPFFILSLVFGYIAIVAQKTIPAYNYLNLSGTDSFFFGNYALVLYLIKSVFPFNLCGYHPYPLNNTGMGQLIIYLSPLIVAALVIIFYKTMRNKKHIILGSLFFLFTIFPVLQFLPVGETIVAERYTYIPFIGLFYVIAQFLYHAEQYRFIRSVKYYVNYILLLFVIILAMITRDRIIVWKDSITFWTDVISHYPKSHVPYNNRGHMYNELRQHDIALADLNKGISLDSTYGRLFLNRGLSYSRKEMYNAALADYTHAIRLDTGDLMSYLHRGSLYVDAFGKYDLGIDDFKRILKNDSGNASALFTLGVAYFKKGDNNNAIEQYDKALRVDPQNAQIYYYRALAYAAGAKYSNALIDANEAENMGYNADKNLIGEWELMVKDSNSQTIGESKKY